MNHPLPRPVHHYAYVVDDIEEAIGHFVTTLGAGPFFMLENVPLENVRYHGEPAVFEHTAAFGQCGTMAIELQEIHRCEPAEMSDRFVTPAPGLHHIAWVVPDLDQASAELAEKHNAPLFLQANVGEITHYHHDATQTLGHFVELHKDVPALHGFFGMLKEASVDWDGRDPIRIPTL
ncbi:MAG TPA: VOC family protein [Solirubrobacteraceae bacterium]|nr:VOC family protein [Solirubrobacteraceae bacterium]